MLTDFQYYIAKSRYARYIPELKRRETWEETVERYVNYLFSLHPETFPKDEIKENILNMKVMPSMRAVMTAGKALDRDAAASYNCSYLAIDDQRAFDEAMYLLMVGTGVGYSVERQFISKLPVVADEFFETDSVIVVKDSRIGWASSLKELISLLYQGLVPKWDLSFLRPAGAPLKTFGGRSSGPEPLNELFKFFVTTFKNASGRKLNSVECNDLMCKIGEAVVVGGVRRSACICLTNLSDDRMRVAKSGQWWNEHAQRALANISVAYTEKPDVGQFMEEWLSLYNSKSGERGIFNRVAAVKKIKSIGRRNPEPIREAGGMNPCQPAYSKVLTPDGIKEFKDIDTGSVIWSNEGWTTVVDKWSTGIKPVYKYQTSAGIFYGTENHRVLQNGEKIEVKDAETIDIIRGIYENNYTIEPEDIIDGLIIGDGSKHEASNNLILLHIGENDYDYFESEIKNLIVKHRPGINGTAYEVHTTITKEELPKTYERRVPERFIKDKNKLVGFLRGLYSANGSVCSNRITLKSASKGLIEDVQLMLNSIGIKSYFTTNKESNVKFSNGEYLCKESYDLNITTDREKFVNTIGFIQKYKTEKIKILNSKDKKISYDIIGVEYLGDEEVFDITVNNDSHTYWTQGCNVSNCGEIVLRSCGFCNLSEVIIRPDDTLKTILEKVRIATIIGTHQATFTNFRYLRSIWKRNAEEERLLGVSLTGIMDHEVFSGKKGYDVLADWLTKMKEVAIETNKELAEKLGINQSVSITTVKPSGTVSQLVDSASGIHPRFSEYYIRTVRSDNTDPLTKFMKESGIPNEPDVTKPFNTTVFSFPMKSPENSVTSTELNAIQQLEIDAIYNKYWTEHNVSITVYVRENEWFEVGAWVYKNFDDINGVSFLPYSDHSYKQAPYQPISKEDYEKWLEKMPVIDWSNFNVEEHQDNTVGSQTFACSGGACEII